MMVRVMIIFIIMMMQDKLEMSPAEVDSLGRVVVEAVDHWEPRSGIGLALAKIAPYYSSNQVTLAVIIIINNDNDNDND